MPNSRSRAKSNSAVRLRTARALVAVAALAIAGGCSEPAKYKVLTFFFTGVPAPGSQPAGEQGSSSGAGALDKARAKLKEEVALAAKKAAARRQAALAKIFTHGPVAAGACNMCHSLASTSSFGGQQQKQGSSALPSFGARLLAPPQRLCATCHGKSMRFAGRWQHGPAANGDCVACHDPHRSARLYMLRDAPGALCVTCHASKSGAAIEAAGDWTHGPVANDQCTVCHDPHAADQPAMVKGASIASLCTECHDAAAVEANPVHPDDELPDCVTCHDPHGSQQAFLLRS